MKKSKLIILAAAAVMSVMLGACGADSAGSARTNVKVEQEAGSNNENQDVNASNDVDMVKTDKAVNADKTAAAVTSEGNAVDIKKVSASKTSVKEKSRSSYTIGIDAGHQIKADTSTEPIGPGSSTTKPKVTGGTSGTTTGLHEFQLNLRVAKKLRKELKNRGYNVKMSRTKNHVNISNKERAQKLNRSCDIVIRLHADGATSSSAHGASALYPSTSNPYVGSLSAKSKKLSTAVLNAYCSRTGISNRGLSIRDDLTGTNWSKVPVTLLEMGFMTNASDDRYMASKSNETTMAEGIADGIDDYFGF